MDNNELTHHGTKGMRWGIRRYQNPDGSLKPAGRKRYGSDGDGNAGGKKTTKGKASSDKTSAPKKKSVSEMTDAELTSAIRRSQLEAQYKQLNPEKVSSGKKFMSKMINEAIVPAAVSSGRRFLEKALGDMIEKKFGDGAADGAEATISSLKKTYEKLDLETKIDKLKNPDKYETWDDKAKRRAYEDETARRQAEADAAAKAKKTESASARKEHADDPAVNEFIRRTNSDAGSSERRQTQAETTASRVNKYTIDMEYEPAGERYVRSNSATTTSQQTVNTGRSYVDDYLASIGVRRVDD